MSTVRGRAAALMMLLCLILLASCAGPEALPPTAVAPTAPAPTRAADSATAQPSPVATEVAVASTPTPRPQPKMRTPSATPVPSLVPTVVAEPVSYPAGSRGAQAPWVEYEAEDASTNGTLLGPSRKFGEIPAEASGRLAVQLDAVGQYVELTATEAANSIVVRYAIPDAPQGGGITATLSLYVDGEFRQKLTLTSRYAWSYGGETNALNEPAAGGAHHFFDEVRALVGDIPAGASVRLQRDQDDEAEYYVVDLVDLEPVGAPLERPESGYLSIVDDCGATPDDGADDSAGLFACITGARARGLGVWIPQGTFHFLEEQQEGWQGFPVSNVTIRGAGMWHTTLRGFYARFHCTGNGCRFHDFAILGETVTRDNKSPENGFNGGAGSGSLLENIWVEHTKVGYWVGAGPTNVTNGLIVRGSRFRNTFADGINLCNGTSNSVVENSHFRNTGDDAIASWSPSRNGPVNVNNTFRFNTVQVPWRANCFAIYGGRDNKVEDNLCYDVVTYPGILIGQLFGAHPFAGTTSVQRNSLIRAGGNMWRQEHGALKVHAEEGDIAGLVIRDLLIEDSTFSGVQLDGGHKVSALTLENIEVVRPGTWGLHLTSTLSGDATVSGVSVVEPGREPMMNYAPAKFFALTKGEGNVGW